MSMSRTTCADTRETIWSMCPLERRGSGGGCEGGRGIMLLVATVKSFSRIKEGGGIINDSAKKTVPTEKLSNKYTII